MPARIGSVMCRLFGRPGRLYMIDVAERAHGSSTQPPHVLNWSGVIGASLAPKSTVLFEIAEIPPPLPIGLYEIFTPLAASYLVCQAAMSGAGNVAPAPLSSSALERACAPVVRPTATAVTATTRTESTPRGRFLRVTNSFMTLLESPFVVFAPGWGRRQGRSLFLKSGVRNGEDVVSGL